MSRVLLVVLPLPLLSLHVRISKKQKEKGEAIHLRLPQSHLSLLVRIEIKKEIKKENMYLRPNDAGHVVGPFLVIMAFSNTPRGFIA